ncbi:MAG: DJ-1/PfpI family protein [Calditrichia bacterium]
MGSLAGKKILVVVGQRNYNFREFDYLSNQLSEAGALVSVASNSLDRALGRLEGFVVPDLAIADAPVEDFDAVVVVGGYGAYMFLWHDKALHTLLQKASQAGKIIAGASVAAAALASAGILKGKKATVYPDYKANVIFMENGVEYIHEHVVVSDNIITSSDPRHVAEFTEKITEKLSGVYEQES